MGILNMKLIMLKIVSVFIIFVFSSVVYAASPGDWMENFDDSNYRDTFDYGVGVMGSGTYNSVFIDRPGHGRALQVSSNVPEVIPIFFGLSNNFGVRWKFDLWIGPRTGTPRHTAGHLKFIHRGSAGGGGHCFFLKQMGLSDSRVRKTNLITGNEQPSAPSLDSGNLHFCIQDPQNSWHNNINNTNLSQYRGQWITVEFEIVTGTPSSTKIWVNGNLDFYRVSNGGLWDNIWLGQCHFVNYSNSANGDVYLAVDNFYKYDTVKTGSGNPNPLTPPLNLRSTGN